MPDSARRPLDLTPAELGYTPRKPVPWLAPQLLAGTAVRVVLAQLFGAYLDKRELQGALPAEVYRHDGGEEVWLDYVADSGDGFDATYSVAWLAAQQQLDVTDPTGATHPTVRGEALVLGGDQVYPTASWRHYEDRCKGPFRTAVPVAAEGNPTMYALPGNHDWYDGLTAFLRLFAKGVPIGGYRTRQRRSYFALALPQRWWLFAIDVQFDAYLDDPQMSYFKAAAAQLQPGDRVIVCTPEPAWVHADEVGDEYDTIDYFIRTVIVPTGAEVAVLLSGDAHHYARYEITTPAAPAPAPEPSPPPETPEPVATTSPKPATAAAQLITCGGGGAYLFPTHHLPDQLTVPPKATITREASPRQEYDLASTYPTKPRSRRLSWGVFSRLPRRNPGFSTLLGVLHTVLLLAFVNAGQSVVTVPTVTMVALVLGATIAFASPRPGAPRRTRHWVLGVGHGLAHLVISLVAAVAWLSLPFTTLREPVGVLAALGFAVVAGLVATELVAAYLMIAGRYNINANELFAGQGIEDYKSFLRLHIGRDGTLTVYPVAVDKVCRAWRPTPNDPPEAPWLAPAAGLSARLIEAPVRVAPAPAAAPTLAAPAQSE